MSPLTTIAVRAARAAGDFLLRTGERLHELRVEMKGPNDFVSEADREAERRIVEIIHRAYPDHAILGEEGGAQGEVGSHGARWIIDPLDGTTNYLHDLPWYSVSIALEIRGRLEVGVVYDPVRNELFVAERGKERAWTTGACASVSTSSWPVRSSAPASHSSRSATWMPTRSPSRPCHWPVAPSVVPVRQRWIWPTWPPAVSMVSGSLACSRGTSRPGCC